MTGKALFASIAAGVIAFAVVVTVINNNNYDSFWKIWNIPMMSLHFADLRNLTGAAESISAGYDPLYENPKDPWGRTLNQPRIVQYIVSSLGLSNDVTAFVGIAFDILFFVGIFIFCQAFDKITALALSLFAFSPAIMLGLERGNHDLFIFFLVCLALAVSSTPVAAFLLLISAFIKLFPVFSIGYFLRCEKQSFWLYTCVFSALFAAYLYFNRADLKPIFEATQKGYGLLAYGSRSFAHLSLWQFAGPVFGYYG